LVDLNSVVLFTKVVETGSFTAAARALSIPKASLSRKIARLESELGARLIDRTTRRLALTALGRSYYDEARMALSRLASAEEQVTSRQATPAGTLRVAAPVEFGVRNLMQWIPDFLDAYPKINLELILSDDFIDLVAKRIDVAFRTGRMKSSSSLVTRKLGIARRILVASAAYLEKRGTPKSVHDLADHDAIIFGSTLTNVIWHLHGSSGRRPRIDIRVHGRIAVDTGRAATEATLRGLGIALLPAGLVGDELRDGSLRHILPTYFVDGGGLHMIHGGHPTVALRTFLDFGARRMTH
jgi:DNA-binding transcriptional LysR family regulator